MDFWRIVAIVNKRKWLIMLSVVVTAILTLGATKLVGSKWMAIVSFSADSPLRTALAGGEQQDTIRGKMIADQMAEVYTSQITNPRVLGPALQKLGLSDLPDEMIREIGFVAINSHLYQLQVTDSDPIRAGELANALADEFEKSQTEMATANMRGPIALLKKQVKEADEELRVARAELDAFRAKYRIFGPNNGSFELEGYLTRASINAQQVDMLKEQLASAQAQLRMLSTRSANEEIPVEATEPDKPAGAASDKKMDEQPDAELKAIDEQIALYSKKYTANHPRMKEATARRKIILAQIAEEERKAVASAAPRTPAERAAYERHQRQKEIAEQKAALRTEIASIQAQLRESSSARVSAEGETGRFHGIDGPLAALSATVDEKRQARAGLVAGLNKAELDLKVAEQEKPLKVARKVGQFNPVQNLTQGRTRKLLILAILCALIGTTALVVAFDSIDRRLRNVNEAQSALPGRMLAAIPQPLGDVSYATLARATELHPQSLHSESYRFLAYQLLSAGGSKARSIMVVAAKAEQGSTTTLTNLGITLAQAGKKVVVVDANMRTAELHTVFDLDNDFGYMDLLQNPSAEAVDKAMKSTTVENLHVITNGTQPDNPWQLFRSDNLKSVSRELLDKADYVLYDTPSALLFTDSLNLAPVVDGAFLCVRALQQLTGAEQRLVGLLEQSNVQILGSVLTDLPPAVLEGYDNYRHYYGPALQAARGSSGTGMDGNGGSGMFALPSADNSKSDGPQANG
jgi:capsular exopolysaccharide synthesis family protein